MAPLPLHRCHLFQKQFRLPERDSSRHIGIFIQHFSKNIMVRVKPFAAIRPPKDSVTEVAAPPYDVLNSEEAKEIQEEDVNTLFYENGLIDLDNVTLDQINLSLPFKPLCGELCKGICPICGKDLNEGPCGCEVKRKDPRIQKITDTLRGK